MQQQSNQPQTNRTDFKSWERANLEAFAREAADDNKRLREENKAVLQAWRDLLKETQG